MTVPLTRIGTTSISGGATSTDQAVDLTEIDAATNGDADTGNGDGEAEGVNRTVLTP